MSNHHALFIGSDPALKKSALGFLEGRGYGYVVAESVKEAFQKLARDNFHFTLLDFTGNRDGLNLVPRLRLQGGDPGALIACINSTGTPGETEALSLLVDVVIQRPFTDDGLEAAINAVATLSPAVPHAPGEQSVARIRREMDLWRSPAMRDVVAIIREAAGADITVLVTGETGTGKDLVARAIHSLSPRRTAPFVKVNCAAVPRDLLESELFGHERGAFTGAHKLKIGKFESAHRGTIFLDEIGDLHPDLQGKLLHVLQDGEFSRVGAKSALKVDVRVIAATNQNLAQAARGGRFREDLYYRLNVIQVAVPPLRERLEEIPLLLDYFVQLNSKLFRREGFAIPPSVMARLAQYDFPGNVRELENIIKRMIVLGDPHLARIPLQTDGAPKSTDGDAHVSTAEPSLKEIGRRAALAAQREAITRVLQETGWNRLQTAKSLKVSYRSLLYTMKEAGLRGGRGTISVPSSEPGRLGGNTS